MKKVNFLDGAESSTVPTIGSVEASNLARHGSDAAFIAVNPDSPQAGDIYFNTDLDTIRYYDGTEWKTVAQSVEGFDDVNISDPQDGEQLVYDGGEGKWTNANADADKINYDNSASTLASTNVNQAIDEISGYFNVLDQEKTQLQNQVDNLELKDLANVDDDLDTGNGQVLGYNGNTGQWEATDPSLAGLYDDVDLTVAPTDGQVLTYDNGDGKWKAEDPSGGAEELDDLSDVDLTVAPTNGQALVYDSGDDKWKAGDVAASGGGDVVSVNLNASETDEPTGFEFDATEHSGAAVEFFLLDSNDESRTGVFYIATNGTDVSFGQSFVETDDMDFVFTADLSLGMVRLLYTSGLETAILRTKTTLFEGS